MEAEEFVGSAKKRRVHVDQPASSTNLGDRSPPILQQPAIAIIKDIKVPDDWIVQLMNDHLIYCRGLNLDEETEKCSWKLIKSFIHKNHVDVMYQYPVWFGSANF